MMKKAMLLLAVVLCLGGTQVQADTAIFKQGFDLSGTLIGGTGGYQGVLDNAIESEYPEWTDGWVYSVANLCGDFSGGSYSTRMVQIRYQDLFGPGAIPAGATIQSAKLRLGIVEGYRAAPTAVKVYEALSPWYATAAEMSTSGYRQYMAAPKVGWGASNTASLPVQGEDFSATSTDVAVDFSAFWNGTDYYTPYVIQRWVEVDVTAAVQGYQSGGTNWGWYVSSNSPGWADGMLRMATSDASSEGWRPELVVTYDARPVYGKIRLQGYTGDNTSVLVKFEFRKSGVVQRSENVILAADGSFTISSVAADTYDVAIKACCWLRTIVSPVVVNGPVNLNTIDLTSGDISGDNEVDSSDLAGVLASMDAVGPN